MEHAGEILMKEEKWVWKYWSKIKVVVVVVGVSSSSSRSRNRSRGETERDLFFLFSSFFGLCRLMGWSGRWRYRQVLHPTPSSLCSDNIHSPPSLFLSHKTDYLNGLGSAKTANPLPLTCQPHLSSTSNPLPSTYSPLNQPINRLLNPNLPTHYLYPTYSLLLSCQPLISLCNPSIEHECVVFVELYICRVKYPWSL